MPYLINEDEALKTLLTGITVSDSEKDQRTVGVFFGQPDVQIRQQAYPYIVIDLVGVSEDFTRAHRGIATLPYTPDFVVSNVDVVTSYPIPVTLSYQITTYARQPRHDRQLINAILSPTKIPFRFGTLSIPEDGTVRRLDMIGFVKRDVTEQDKRLFSNAFNVQVSAEFLADELAQIYKVLYPPTITTNSSTDPYTILSV
jgi:hypothetical protein